MSEVVEQKTVELMDRAANAVEAFAGKLDSLATQYGPEVADAAMAVARLDAANALMLQMFSLVALLLIVVAGWRVVPLAYKSASADMDVGFGLFVGCMTAGPFALAGGLLFFKYVATVWPLAGVIEPKLWIAKQVLGL